MPLNAPGAQDVTMQRLRVLRRMVDTATQQIEDERAKAAAADEKASRIEADKAVLQNMLDETATQPAKKLDKLVKNAKEQAKKELAKKTATGKQQGKIHIAKMYHWQKLLDEVHALAPSSKPSGEPVTDDEEAELQRPLTGGDREAGAPAAKRARPAAAAAAAAAPAQRKTGDGESEDDADDDE
eukprot:TRINITY_DN16477_c0_g1_i2.p2 TRINITY_DN16477_c0_g1~~TRINITY_DN16477_c0_g1_i2.p2  ORF type:complete len:184 (+),score=62.51 TRINITY_DN16477_c0_g1_i2:71-622(+)